MDRCVYISERVAPMRVPQSPLLTYGSEAIKAVKLCMSKRFTVHPDWEVTIAATDMYTYCHKCVCLCGVGICQGNSEVSGGNLSLV